MSIVLGVGQPIINCQLGNRNFNYTLPLTNNDGRQIEEWEVKKIRHYLQGLDINDPSEEISERILGYRISWTFSYSSFMDGEDVVTLNNIITRHKQGYKLTLTPRDDQPNRKFVVVPDSDTLAIGINAGGYNASNNGLVFRLITKNIEQSLNIEIAVDPDAITYGTIFGAGVLTGQKI